MGRSPRLGRALAAGLAAVAIGLTNNAPSLAASNNTTSGAMGQWLFNGVWRVKVTSVDPYMDSGAQVGWQVTEVWHNGTTQTVAPGDTLEKAQVVTLSDGTKMSSDATTGTSVSAQDLDYHAFAQATQYTHIELFRWATGSGNASIKPKTLDIVFDGATLSQSRSHPHFTTSRYDFEFDLTRTASANVANAAGGSEELPARNGCLNQWMSNGVWKVRVTAYAPESAANWAWDVTETWVNVTHQAIDPSDLQAQDQQLVFANGDTLSSTNTAGSNLQQQAIYFHNFAPGASFTSQEFFRQDQAALDATQTPVKIILAFDAATANQSSSRPHYTVNPPNYRISLTCKQ